MLVRLISKTTGAIGTEYEAKSIDEIIVGIARISSSRDINELFVEPEKLIRHCLLNGHYSIFEMANLTFEITTSRAMGRELLRHFKQVGGQERLRGKCRKSRTEKPKEKPRSILKHSPMEGHQCAAMQNAKNANFERKNRY